MRPKILGTWEDFWESGVNLGRLATELLPDVASGRKWKAVSNKCQEQKMIMQSWVSGRILFQQVQISSFLPNICMNIRMKILRIFKEGSFYGWITLCAMCTTMCTLHKGDCWLKVLIPHLGQSYYFCRQQRKKWKKKPKTWTVYVYVSKSVIEDK